jgi:teichuronic acid exporter
MSLRNSATKGIVWTFAEQFGNQFIGFIISVILARILLPEQFGLIGMIAIFVAIGNTLLHSGLTKSLIRTEDVDTDDYSTVFYFNLFASILVYISIYLLAPVIASFYDQIELIQLIRVYCITFIFTGLSAVQIARLTKNMDFRIQTIIAIPAAIAGGIVGVVMALYGFGVWSLVWSSVITALVNSVQLWFYSNWHPTSNFDFKKLKVHLSYGYKLTISELLDRFFQNIFIIIIGKYFSAGQVGFYTRAETMNQLPVKNLSRALDKVTFPLFVKIKNNESKLRSVYKRLMGTVVFVVTPVMVTLAILAEPLFRFLFTEKWLPAVPYFQILCLTGILFPIHSYNLGVVNVKGRSDIFLKLEVIKKILIVVMLIVAVPFGIKALLYGQVIISILAFFINSHYSGKFLNYTAFQQLKDILPIFLLSIISGGVLMTLDLFILIDFNDLVRILLGAFFSILVYGFLAYFLKFENLNELKKLIHTK